MKLLIFPSKIFYAPPVESCVKCSGRLSLHNKPANVTIFKLSAPVQGIKISLFIFSESRRIYVYL